MLDEEVEVLKDYLLLLTGTLLTALAFNFFYPSQDCSGE